MEKSLVLSVSAGVGCYRHIQIAEGATLFTLHKTILDAFDFDDDHLHAFFVYDRALDEKVEYMCPEGDLNHARGYTNKVRLSKIRLKKDDAFLYVYDFGDVWRFQIKVLRVLDEATKTPTVLKTVGEVDQYGNDDYEDDVSDW